MIGFSKLSDARFLLQLIEVIVLEIQMRLSLDFLLHSRPRQASNAQRSEAPQPIIIYLPGGGGDPVCE